LSQYGGDEGIKCLLAANQGAAIGEYENGQFGVIFFKPVTTFSIACEK